MSKKKSNQSTIATDQVTLTDTPKDKEMTIASDVSSLNPLKSNSYYAGDSVNEHKELEKANFDLAKEELRQQNENNALD